jgi:hypothetical protein
MRVVIVNDGWAKKLTDGDGADFVISALGAKAPVDTMLDSL